MEQQRRMKKRYPAAAALVGVAPIEAADVTLNQTFTRWLAVQHRLAGLLQLLYVGAGATMEASSSVPRICLREEEEPPLEVPPLLMLTEQTTDECWLWLRLVMTVGLFADPMDWCSVSRCCSQWRHTVREMCPSPHIRSATRSLSASQKRHFVVNLLCGKVIEIAFAYTGVQSSLLP